MPSSAWISFFCILLSLLSHKMNSHGSRAFGLLGVGRMSNMFNKREKDLRVIEEYIYSSTHFQLFVAFAQKLRAKFYQRRPTSTANTTALTCAVACYLLAYRLAHDWYAVLQSTAGMFLLTVYM